MSQLEQRLDAIKLEAAAAAQQQLGGVEVDASREGAGNEQSAEKWGMPLNELYRLGLGFFKGK